MLGDFSVVEIARRVLVGPDDPEALAALLEGDDLLPYPLGSVLWLERAAPGEAEDGVSAAATCRVFYTVAEDGRETVAMAHLGAFMVTALGALLAEEGWSPAIAATLAQAHQMAAAEGDEESLAGWAMGTMLHDRSISRISRRGFRRDYL